MKADPQQALTSYWGHAQFRPQQLEIINAVLPVRCRRAAATRRKIALLQIPALLQEGLVLVISPLLSLMRDQVMQPHQ